MIEGDDFEGSRVVRDHTAGSRTGRVAKRLGQLLRGTEGATGSLGAMIDITDTLSGAITIAVAIGPGQDIAVMVSGVWNTKGVTGNDGDTTVAAERS